MCSKKNPILQIESQQSQICFFIANTIIFDEYQFYCNFPRVIEDGFVDRLEYQLLRDRRQSNVVLDLVPERAVVVSIARCSSLFDSPICARLTISTPMQSYRKASGVHGYRSAWIQKCIGGRGRGDSVNNLHVRTNVDS